jgi:hypothetical protein
MGAGEIRELLKRKPFLPFRLHLTNGLTFEVTNAELATVGRRVLTLSLPPEGDIEKEAIISLMHIIWIEKNTPTM